MLRPDASMRLILLPVFIAYLSLVNCLHEDQKGKFDWRKQFVGIPSFTYYHPGAETIIVGTKSNVIASLHKRDGSIIWRQIMPDMCELKDVSVLKSTEDHQDFIVRTYCDGPNGNHSLFWNPNNGLLSSETKYNEIVDDDQAESELANRGHSVGQAKAFTISDDLSLIVAEDGNVSLKAGDVTMWSRDESFASISAVEIFRLPTDMRDRFGLKKMIVLVTELGTISGLDTITGQTEWTLFEPEFATVGQKSHSLLIVARQSDEDASQSRAIVINPKGLVLLINPITGEVVERKTFPSRIIQAALVDADSVHETRGAILLDELNNVHIYPEDLSNRVKNELSKYYMILANTESPVIEGLRFKLVANRIEPETLWTIPFDRTEKILSFSLKRFDEEVHSPARVLGDRGILYKYLNPNLIAVLTQSTTGDLCSPSHSINVYLIDGVTGALVHNIHHPKSRGPSKMVHSENWIVYSYYNMKARRNEISSLEMFEGSVQSNSSAFSSLSKGPIRPKLVEQKSFIFPSGIDAMVETRTLRGMTNKHLIVALPTGALLEIPKIFLDPRRPITMLMEHREEGLIPYMPELPIPSESIINYDQSLLAVRHVATSPAMLESTSLVFAWGLDLFFTRVTPSKTFDILKDDFDHVLISGVLIFLVVASYVTKILAQRKALRAAWK